MSEKKDVYYFSHDVGARNDIKIMKLRKKFGNFCGYGFYFMILELLREERTHKLNLDDLDIISNLLGTTEKELRSFLDYCFSIKLFTQKDGYFFSQNFIDRMLKIAKISKERRTSVSKRWTNFNDFSEKSAI